jgi:hypothetical protein
MIPNLLSTNRLSESSNLILPLLGVLILCLSSMIWLILRVVKAYNTGNIDTSNDASVPEYNRDQNPIASRVELLYTIFGILSFAYMTYATAGIILKEISLE